MFHLAGLAMVNSRRGVCSENPGAFWTSSTDQLTPPSLDPASSRLRGWRCLSRQTTAYEVTRYFLPSAYWHWIQLDAALSSQAVLSSQSNALIAAVVASAAPLLVSMRMPIAANC